MTAADMQAWWDNRFVQILVTVIVGLIVQVASRRFIDRIVRRAVRPRYHNNEADEQKREKTLIAVFHTLAGVIIWIVVLIAIMIEMRVNIAGLLTGAGLIGVVASLGAQNIIKDVLAGTFIIMENQYRVGDVVRLSAGLPGGVSGMVEDITVRITKLRDMDGNLHTIANGSAGVVTNMTFQFANVNIDVPVSYDADIELVKKIINQVGIELAGDKTLGHDISEAVQFLRVDSFGDSTFVVKAVGKVRAGTQWDVAGEFRKRLLAAFEKHGLSAPYPHIVVRNQPAPRATSRRKH